MYTLELFWPAASFSPLFSHEKEYRQTNVFKKEIMQLCQCIHVHKKKTVLDWALYT